MCAHKSGDVINVITVACRIYSRLKCHKNYKNRLSLAKVIVKNKMSRFYGSLCRMIVLHHAENRTIVSSFIWTKHRNMTEGQTDNRFG